MLSETVDFPKVVERKIMVSTKLGGLKQYTIMRFLGELEEAVGSLLAINLYENSLLVTMDSVEFTIDFPSIHFLELAREQLSPYLGKRVAIFLDSNTTKLLHIRPVAPNNELMVGVYQQ